MYKIVFTILTFFSLTLVNAQTVSRLISTYYYYPANTQSDTTNYFYNTNTYGYDPTSGEIDFTISSFYDYIGYPINTQNLYDKSITSDLPSSSPTDSTLINFNSNHQYNYIYHTSFGDEYYSTLTYNSNNLPLVDSSFVFNTNTNQWEGSDKSTYWHNSSGELVLLVNEYWDANISNWEYYVKDSIVRPSNTQTIHYMSYWDGADWILSEKNTLNHTTSNILLSIIQEVDNGNGWENLYKEINNLNGYGQIVNHYTYDWDGAIWSVEQGAKDSFIYSSSTSILPSSRIYYFYDTLSNGYKNYSRTDFEYNSFNQVTRKEIYFWTASNSWSFNSYQNYHYNMVSGPTNSYNSILGTKVILYPNPANETINIQFASNQNFQGLFVTDMLGNKVLQSTQPINSLSISKLAKGIYMLHVTLNNQLYQTKFIKE